MTKKKSTTTPPKMAQLLQKSQFKLSKKPTLVSVGSKKPELSLVFALKAKLKFSKKSTGHRSSVQALNKTMRRKNVLRKTMRQVLESDAPVFLDFLENFEYCSELAALWRALGEFEDVPELDKPARSRELYATFLAPDGPQFVSTVSARNSQACGVSFDSVRDEVLDYFAEKKLERFSLWLKREDERLAVEAADALPVLPHRSDDDDAAYFRAMDRRDEQTPSKPPRPKRQSSVGDICDAPLDDVKSALRRDADMARAKIQEARLSQNPKNPAETAANGYLDVSSRIAQDNNAAEPDDETSSSRLLAADGYFEDPDDFQSDSSENSSDDLEQSSSSSRRLSYLLGSRRKSSSSGGSSFSQRSRRRRTVSPRPRKMSAKVAPYGTKKRFSTGFIIPETLRRLSNSTPATAIRRLSQKIIVVRRKSSSAPLLVTPQDSSEDDEDFSVADLFDNLNRRSSLLPEDDDPPRPDDDD